MGLSAPPDPASPTWVPVPLDPGVLYKRRSVSLNTDEFHCDNDA
jgi:hypothetical protein